MPHKNSTVKCQSNMQRKENHSVLTILPLVHSSERSLRYTGRHLPHSFHPQQMSQSTGCSLQKHTMPLPFSPIPKMKAVYISNQYNLVQEKNLLREQIMQRYLPHGCCHHLHQLCYPTKQKGNYQDLMGQPAKGNIQSQTKKEKKNRIVD